MRYPNFRAQGLFVGSGVIEAGCKTVIGARLKCSGMFWTVRGPRHHRPALLPPQPALEITGLIVSRMSAYIFVAHPEPPARGESRNPHLAPIGNGRRFGPARPQAVCPVRPPEPGPCAYTSDSKLSRLAESIVKVYLSCPSSLRPRWWRRRKQADRCDNARNFTILFQCPG